MAKLSDLKTLLSARQNRRGSAAKTAADATQPVGTTPARPATASRENASALATSAAPTQPAVSATKPTRPVAARTAAQPTRDIDLNEVFGDVVPLPRANRARIDPPRPPPRPAQRIADEADALTMSKYGSEPSPSSWEIGQEQEAGQTFVRAGIGTDVLAKLRRGQWVVQGELDLHRHNTEQAHDALADFLFEARSRGWRCVRVIHGKGLTSPRREPVLKGKVRRWLSVWDDVLAYSEAPPHAGGGGAVLVLLKAGAS